MAEGFSPYDDFPSDEEFDRVEDRVAPTSRVPMRYGLDFVLTPANAAVRLFFAGGPETILDPEAPGIDDLELDGYSRVVVFLDDGSEAPIKPDDDLIRGMVKGGFPIQVPRQPDASDREFMDTYMRIWTEDINAELGLN